METFNISRKKIMNGSPFTYDIDRWAVTITKYDTHTLSTLIFDMKDMTGNMDHILVSNSEKKINKFMEYTGIQIHFIDE